MVINRRLGIAPLKTREQSVITTGNLNDYKKKESASDIKAITQVTIAAFIAFPISNYTEQFVIKALRAAGALTLALVAKIDERVVGHAAFSPVILFKGAKD